MVIKSYHIILGVKILGWFLLKWAGFGELLGWKSQPDLATLEAGGFSDSHGEADADSLASDKER